MRSTIGDIRLAFRQLRKERAFTLTVLATLAICVGANSAIFSVIQTVLLAPLPFRDSDRLVVMMNSYPGAGAERGGTGPFDYWGRRDRSPWFESMAQYRSWGSTVGEAGATKRMGIMDVTASFFPMLGVQAAMGRTFREEEMDEGNGHVAVLSYEFWQDHFDADTNVLERDLRVDGQPYRVVGVLPAGFRMPENEQPRFYVPLTYSAEERAIMSWHSNRYSMMARMRPGVTVDEARTGNDALNASLIAEWPIANGAQMLKDLGYRMLIEPAHADLVRDVKSTLYMLWGGVVFVLLIGCVNIANLILARTRVKERETATRLAIGAPRTRLVRERMIHALVLAVGGGLLGIAVGLGGIRLLATFGATELPRGVEIGMNPTVLVFTLGVAAVAGLIFGAIPSLQLLRADLRSVLNTASRGATADRQTLWMRMSLVTAQVALAFLLLIGAGLMLTSFRSATRVDPGFDTDGVFTAAVSLPGSRYPNGESRVQFAEALSRDMGELAGVHHAGIGTIVPFGGDYSATVIMPEGYSPPAGESLIAPTQTRVAGDYFEALGIPLLEGRYFEPTDGQDSRRVVILDQWLAHRYFGDESPLGKRMLVGNVPEEAREVDYFTIVGVVGTIKQRELTAGPGDQVGSYYLPYSVNASLNIMLVAGAAGNPLELTAGVRQAVARRDPELPVYDIRTMRDRVEATLMNRRASMFILLVFSGVALFLAVIGIYGVLAYIVAQRRREMGIRMALGSTTQQIFAIVLRHGALVTGAGLIVGAAGAALMGGLIRSLLFQVEPVDPIVMGSVAAILGAVGLLACAVPALQATRVDPVKALVGE